MPSLRARILYTAMKLFYGRIFPPEMPIEKLRKGQNAARSVEPLPPDIRTESHPLGGVPGEWLHPATFTPDSALLYLHGGGYVVKSPAIHRVLVGRLAQAAHLRAFMADYRLAPESPFPAALEDAAAAYTGLLAQGIEPSRVVIAGDSAGGGLTAALLLHLRDSGKPLPAAAALLSGWLDVSLSSPALTALQKRDPFLRVQDLRRWAGHYAAGHDLRSPLISPLFGDLTGLPPMLIYAGEYEVLRADSVAFAEKAKAAGVNAILKVWPGMIHAFPLFAGMVPEGKAAIAEVSAFFRAQLGVV